jgi:hypothetical protein
MNDLDHVHPRIGIRGNPDADPGRPPGTSDVPDRFPILYPGQPGSQEKAFQRPPSAYRIYPCYRSRATRTSSRDPFDGWQAFIRIPSRGKTGQPDLLKEERLVFVQPLKIPLGDRGNPGQLRRMAGWTHTPEGNTLEGGGGNLSPENGTTRWHHTPDGS